MKKIYILLILVGIANIKTFANDFYVSADNTTPFIDQEVHFRSYPPPGTIVWEFVPNTIEYLDGTTYNSRNPHVKFEAAGCYDVNVTVTDGPNTYYSNQSDYINVSDYPSFEINFSDDNDKGYIAVSISPSVNIISSVTNPVFINHLQFGIMWNKTLVDGNKLDFDMVCESDEVAQLYAIRQEGWPNPNPVPHNTHDDGDIGNWDYRNFENDASVTIKVPAPGWNAGEWYPIAILKVFARTPGHIAPEGDFYIIPPGDANNEHHHFDGDPPYNDPYVWYRFSYNPVIELEHTPVFDIQITDGDPLNPVNFPIPTALSGYYWHGGDRNNHNGYDEYSWNNARNWRVGCGDTDIIPDDPPGLLDDCVIPDVSEYYPGHPDPYYPRNDNAENPGSESANGNNVYIQGGRIEWMKDVMASSEIPLTIWGDLNIGYENIEDDNDVMSNSVSIYDHGYLKIGGDIPTLIEMDVDLSTYSANLKSYESGGLNIYSGSHVDAFYDIYLREDTALIIHSDANGTGSFINSGVILYGPHGTAKVQTYITGIDEAYHMHFVGPTVTDTAYGLNGDLTGVRLQQFNMTTLDTYAFEWDPTVDTSIEDPTPGGPWHGWVNVWPFDVNEPIATGLAITNWHAGSGTMNMVGYLKADTANPVEYQIQCASAPVENQLELISNPFSAAIDFSSLYNYSSNSNYIKGHYWIWDEDAGNYFGGVNGATEGYIQVGQGFFVETKANGILKFPTSIRIHSDVPFRELITNKLKLNVEGGGINYKDRLIIYFTDNVTLGYDEDFELKKWNSIREDATMIRSLASDGSELAINALPLTNFYQQEAVSVPVQFQCGHEGTYTFNFSGIESFDPGSEIWLEDCKLSNGFDDFERSSIPVTVDNPIYTFSASPEDTHDRFVIHFFGPEYSPNSVVESDVENKVKIYSSTNSIYVLNKSEEHIKEISVFNLMGQEIMRTQVPQQDIYKLRLNEPTGYYVVRVRTNMNIYSDKVLVLEN